MQLRDNVYTLNEDFKQQTLELSDALDLDEIQSADLLQDANSASEDLDRPAIITAIMSYHQIRLYSLQCLRLVLEKANNDQLAQEVLSLLQHTISEILHDDQGKPVSVTTYWQQCLGSMEEIEKWMERVSERILRATITEQTQSPEFSEVMEFQRVTLYQQHEELGGVAYQLTQRGPVNTEAMRWLLQKLKTVEKYDAILVHKLPTLLCGLFQQASSDNISTAEDAKSMHHIITSTQENDVWSLNPFQAAVAVVWVSRYIIRFPERSGASTSGNQNAQETDACEICFHNALKNGAFQFLLVLSHDIKPHEWYDPAKQGFHSFLVQDTPALQIEPYSLQDYLQDAVMHCLQDFVESLIINMPYALRLLKHEEDEQRRQFQGRVQLRPNEFDLNLERFLLLISNAYIGDVDASDHYWPDASVELHGFLTWASERQSTPRVAAFCEVLQTLSGDESTANFAHEFLQGVNVPNSSRSRRDSPLSWYHIFRELEYYSSTIRDKPASQGVSGISARSQPDMTVEPESAMMLECYLRLIAHLSCQSPNARDWLLKGSFDMLGNLLLLCSSNIPSRLRACAFTALSGLLTQKTKLTSDTLWTAIDAWLYTQPSAVMPQAPRQQISSVPTAGIEKLILDKIAFGFEEPNAFIGLIISLIEPIGREVSLKHTLPFPEDLGAKYRMSGIETYVDFVLGGVFGPKSDELSDPVQLRIMRYSCLSFAAVCLSQFNEDLIILANRANLNVESAMDTSSLSIYARLHPFARTMEWLFNERVVAATFKAAIQDIYEVNNAGSHSPLVLSVLKSLDVINLVLALQRTYFDIIRPIIKKQSNDRRAIVANAALASFEDAILGRLDLIKTLGLYCASGHVDLAISSLNLLRKLSESRKLSVPIARGSAHEPEKSRLIVALEKDYDAGSISHALANIMEFDERELGTGAATPGIGIKDKILEFLASSLDTAKDSPAVAHLLLGFSCGPHSIFVDNESLFGSANSLFDSVMRFSSVLPDSDPDNSFYVSWLLELRNKAVQIIRRLWRSKLSAQYIVTELRRNDYYCSQAVRFSSINTRTSWDNNSIKDAQFWTTSSANGYASFLRTRSALCELAAIELQSAKENRAASLQSRLMSSLLGSTTVLDGQSFTNATIFELLDFVDLNDRPNFEFPGGQHYPYSMFEACRADDSNGLTIYDIESVQQILLLKQSEALKTSQPRTNDLDTTKQKLLEEAERTRTYFLASNAKAAVVEARLEALNAWVNLATVILGTLEPAESQREYFISQLLRLVLPKLERTLYEDVTTAEILAGFALTVIRNSNFGGDTEADKANDTSVNESLFELFKICLTGVQIPDATGVLRQICSQTCRIFICDACMHHKSSIRRIVQTSKFLGDRLIEVICEDASGGDGFNRLSSMLLLEAMVRATNELGSRYVVDALNRYNFLQIAVKFLASVPLELQQSNENG